MIIRTMEQKDFDEILGMMKIFYDSPAIVHETSEEVLKQDILDCIGECPYVTGYIFDADGTCAGYSMVATGYSTEYGGPCLWVEDLYIKPEYRGQKISKVFFDQLEKEYKGMAVRIRLEVEADNERAMKIYTSAGLEKSPYYVMDKVYKEGE